MSNWEICVIQSGAKSVSTNFYVVTNREGVKIVCIILVSFIPTRLLYVEQIIFIFKAKENSGE